MSDDAREHLDELNHGRAIHGLPPLDKLPDRPASATFDAGDERQAKHRAEEARRAERKRRALVAAVMDMAEGRAWVWELLTRCHVYAAILPSSGLDMAYREGERSIGLLLLADVQASAPDRYAEMVKEANSAVPYVD